MRARFLISFFRTSPSLILLVLLFAVTFKVYSQTENYSTWADSTKITINTSVSGYNTTQDLNNFPYMVQLGKTFNFNQAMKNGEDIRFAHGSAHLSYQIEMWDSTKKTAYIWVLVDKIRGNDSTQSIFMYWGKSGSASQSNGSAVFDTANKFVAVWHFHNSSLADATKNAFTLTNSQTTYSDSGCMGGCRNFPGKADSNYLRVDDNPKLDITDTLTMSAWVNEPNAGSDTKVMGKNVMPAAGYLLGVYGSSVNAEFWDTSNVRINCMGGAIKSGKWAHIAVTWAKGGSVYGYVNGVQVASGGASTYPLSTTSNYFYIGCPGWDLANLLFTGKIDEAVVSHAERSADWLKMCYFNQRLIPSAPPVVKYPNKEIVIPVNSLVNNIVPDITGDFDSLTLTPTLPQSLYFDPQSGSIYGTADEDFARTAFYISAYNAAGYSTDTIYITLGEPSGVRAGMQAGGQLKLIGLSRSSQPAVLFSVPSVKNIAEMTFTLFDLKGSVTWSSHLCSSQIHGSMQSIMICKTSGKIPPGMYFLEMKASITGLKTPIMQRIKAIVK
jgi:hypothetical protein